MNYTIATLEQAHGDLSVNIDKSGNMYLVGIRNRETKVYTHRYFPDMEQAAKKFLMLSGSIVKGMYTERQLRDML